MPVAIRAATRIQDMDDANVTLGVGVDEYALVYDHDTAKFVLRAPAAPFAGILATGATVGATTQAQAFTLGVVTPFDAPASDGTTAWQVRKADKTTSVLSVDTTNERVGIGTTAPTDLIHVYGASSPMAKIADATRHIKIGVVSGYPGVWINQATPSTLNFAFLGTETYSVFNAPGSGNIYFAIGNSNSLRIGSSGGVSIGNDYGDTNALGGTDAGANNLIVQGNVGIGTTAPATQLHVVSTIATTNNLRNILTLGANVTGAGVGAAGLGAAVLFTMETTTTVDTSAASVQAIIYEATHATRKFDLVLNAYDTAIREGLRIRGNGSAPAIGFFGHAPSAQPPAYTPSNVSADRAFDADTVLVAELADVVGTLIADLQSIGLLA